MLEEQQEKLQSEFQEEKRWIEETKMKELQDKMEVLNAAMQSKDAEVAKLQSENQNKLQEKTAVIEKE